MKLQKVVVVLGISVCLIATQMQATFGIGETGQGEDSELTREEELEEVDTKKIEQPVIAEENFLLYWICCFYDGNFKCICLRFH